MVKKKIAKSTFIVIIVILLFISPVYSKKFSSMSSSSVKAGPIHNVATAEDSKQTIRKLCDEQDFSYELLLSIYHADGINSNRAIAEVEKDLSELTYLRDCWASEGYADEDVFDLMIISRGMSIEGCKEYIKANPDYRNNEYLKRVTEYKYYLEQNSQQNKL